MKRHILFLMMIILTLPFVCGDTYQYELENKVLDDGHKLLHLAVPESISSSRYLGWSCNANIIPATVKINGTDCFCLDTDENQQDMIGYGNIIECLKTSNNIINISSSNLLAQTNEGIDVNITIEYTEDLFSGESITISSNENPITQSSEITCNFPETGYDYTTIFYRKQPFSILGKSYGHTFSLSDTIVPLFTGNQIACRVQYKDELGLTGYKDSTNYLELNSISAQAVKAHMAPAYPRVIDDLYCYGYAKYDFTKEFLINNNLEVHHNLNMKKNGVEVHKENFKDTDASTTLYSTKYDLDSNNRGDAFTCNYEVKLFNKTSGTYVFEDSYETEETAIVNTRPLLNIFDINIYFNWLTRSGTDVMEIYNDDAVLIAVITDEGDMELKGEVIEDNVGCSSPTLEFRDDVNSVMSYFDQDGNFCGNVDKSSVCNEGMMQVIDNFSNIVFTVGTDGKICYTGGVIENSNIVSNYVEEPVPQPEPQQQTVLIGVDKVEAFKSFYDSGINFGNQIKFDVNEIPDTATIDSMKLFLYISYQNNIDDDIQVFVIDDHIWDNSIDASDLFSQPILDGNVYSFSSLDENQYSEVDISDLSNSIDVSDNYLTLRYNDYDYWVDLENNSDYDVDAYIGNPMIGDFFVFGGLTDLGKEPYLEITYTE